MPTTNEQIFEIALNGMRVDGSHHKQYALQKILGLLTECPKSELATGDYGGLQFTVTETDWTPLEERLAGDFIYFDDSLAPCHLSDSDYETIERGIAP